MKIKLFIVSLISLAICNVASAVNNDVTPNREILIQGNEIDRYEAFGRAFGIVRYYSPNPYTEKWSDMDWFYVTYQLVKEVTSTTDFTPEKLQQLLSVFAPNATITTQPDNDVCRSIQDTSDYYYWQHTGGGEIRVHAIAKALYKEYRNYKPFFKTLTQCSESPETPQAGQLYSYPIGDGLYLNIPIAEKKDAFSKANTRHILKSSRLTWEKKLKSAGSSQLDRIIAVVSDPDYRVADVITRWNIIRHFYPYYHEDNLQWNEYLPDMLTAMDSFVLSGEPRKDLLSYREKLMGLTSRVKDSHMMLTWDFSVVKLIGGYVTYYYLPLQLNVVDGNIIVEAVSPKCKTGITKKSIIKSVNNINAFDLLKLKTDNRSSSNYNYGLYVSLPDIISSDSRDSLISVTYVNSDGEQFTESLAPTLSNPFYVNDNDKPFISFSDDGIAIIRPQTSSASCKSFVDHIPEIQKSKGIIFDLRGYPTYEFDKILAHFIDTPISNSFISTPITSFPNREYVTYKQNDEYLNPTAPLIDVPVVYLANEHAISWAETVLTLVKGYNLGTIIGSNSCGTNGDATRYWGYIPAFRFMLTANKAVNVDGSQHHGIGVKPDIYAAPTFEGYMEGRDEVLERAIEFIKSR